MRTIKKVEPLHHDKRDDVPTTRAGPRRASSKITEEDRIAKQRLKYLRKKSGLSVEEGARRLGLTRKQLEDVETVRDYGCNVRWTHIKKAAHLYQVSTDVFLHDLPIRGEITIARE